MMDEWDSEPVSCNQSADLLLIQLVVLPVFRAC